MTRGPGDHGGGGRDRAPALERVLAGTGRAGCGDLSAGSAAPGAGSGSGEDP